MRVTPKILTVPLRKKWIEVLVYSHPANVAPNSELLPMLRAYNFRNHLICGLLWLVLRIITSSKHYVSETEPTPDLRLKVSYIWASDAIAEVKNSLTYRAQLKFYPFKEAGFYVPAGA